MSKSPKKRNKPYKGTDAATGPRVTRYSVTEQSAFASWWKDNKRMVLFRTILLLLAILLSWIITQIIHVF
ncbi:MAG TPA: hypothetical protein VLF60_02180 [Candidatus Saccharimonadales bacterium]|nr:hypothetical protein [Candidatus Saccharimonadales bacterium]